MLNSNRIKRIVKRSGGIALVYTLMLLAVLFILGVTFLSISAQDYIFARHLVNRNQAQYLAEAGIEYAQINRINWTDFPHEESFEFAGGVIDIYVEEPAFGVVEITSYGKYASFRRGIRVTYGPDGTIRSWEDV